MISSQKMRGYFGDPVLTAGFLPVPHVFRRNIRNLGLDEATAWFVLELMATFWDPNPPKTLSDIAKEMGRDIATVRRHSQKLNELGLVIIHDVWEGGHRAGNDYDLTPLWEKLIAIVVAESPELPNSRRTRKHRKTRSTTPENDTDASINDAPLVVEQAFNRASMRGMSDTDARHTAHEREVFNHIKEDLKNDQEEAVVVATTTLAQLISAQDARRLIAEHPDCIPHAEALVAQAKTGKTPPGLLVDLIKRGWTPPTGPTSVEAPPDPAAVERAELWQRVCEQLQPELENAEFTTWIAPTQLLEIADGVAVVGAPNVFVRDELIVHYAAEITEAVTRVVGHPTRIEIVIGGS